MLEFRRSCLGRELCLRPSVGWHDVETCLKGAADRLNKRVLLEAHGLLKHWLEWCAGWFKLAPVLVLKHA